MCAALFFLSCMLVALVPNIDIYSLTCIICLRQANLFVFGARCSSLQACHTLCEKPETEREHERLSIFIPCNMHDRRGCGGKLAIHYGLAKERGISMMRRQKHVNKANHGRHYFATRPRDDQRYLI